MKKIGCGLQYNVYPLGNNRVLKKTRTSRERVALWERWGKTNGKFRRTKSDAAARGTVTNLVKATRFIRKHGHRMDLSLLGNPIFVGKFNYTQERGTPILDYIHSHGLKDNKRVLLKYILLVQQLWKYRFAELNHNFTVNFGVNVRGNVFLMDFGEITTSIGRVKQMIKTKAWLRSDSYLGDLEGMEELKRYFAEQALIHWTPRSLKESWKRKFETSRQNMSPEL